MSSGDIMIIGLVLVAIVGFFLYRYNTKITRKMYEAQDMIAQNTITGQIFVIDKKKDKPTPEALTKAVYDQLEGAAKRRKMCMVKAKVGPKIATLICDDPVFEALIPKKSYKVDMAGIYIVGITGADLSAKKKKTLREKAMLYLKGQSSKNGGKKK